VELIGEIDMKDSAREKILEHVTYEARLGFVAFCLDRCLKEAGLHPRARKQLEQLPLLTEALEMLWARAEKGVQPAPERISAILDHIATYDVPAPDAESVIYNYDITLVQSAREVKRGMRVLQDPKAATPEYISFALEHPAQAVDLIYEDGDDAQEKEIAVIDTALLRLRDAGGKKPFSRDVFSGIPEWPRGKLSKKYAENRLKGSAEEEDEQ
jgi:hypothetical protein